MVRRGACGRLLRTVDRWLVRAQARHLAKQPVTGLLTFVKTCFQGMVTRLQFAAFALVERQLGFTGLELDLDALLTHVGRLVLFRFQQTFLARSTKQSRRHTVSSRNRPAYSRAFFSMSS